MVQAGTLSIGTLYMVGHYLQVLVWGPIQAIQWQIQGLQHARASIERVQELLGIPAGLEDGPYDLPDGPLPVAVRDVWFSYEEQQAGECADQPTHNEVDVRENNVLQGVSFNVGVGRILGLLGRTGSGKTTLARLLFRWYDPQQGEIQLGGVDLRQVRVANVRSRVGLVTQDVQLFQASLRDNITFFDESVPDEVLVSALEKLGLGRWLASLPEDLSTSISGEMLSAGEAQLVALARIFLSDPDLVILDEASSRLDPATEKLLEVALDRLLCGRTAIIIAHRLQTVTRAHDIVILEEGQVIESGQRQVLADDPKSHLARLMRTGLGEVLS
jgi:ABC-type multidrug transport system fused ATPase/permease subunit